MIKNIKTIFLIASASCIGSVFLYNCEPEADNLGEQFFTGAELNEKSYDVVAYNINNNDTIKSNAAELQLATLGAFTEGIFGSQKASYVSQLRMATYDPDFGTNAVVDSAVLVLKPLYASDSATTTTDENYIYPEGSVAAKKVLVSYPILKYGKTKIGGNTNFNIKVHEVTDFLGANSDKVFSNKIVNYDASAIGSKTFNGKVNTVTITKDSDNSTIWSNDSSIRIPLNATFFQNKIIAKKGSTDLKDAANFIRYFKGIRISVDENDGYMFQFTPSNAEIIMYYKYDKVDNGTTTRPQTSFKFSLGAPNVHIGQYIYNRTDTPVASALASINSNTGDSKIFIQGMGGPSMGIKIPTSTITDLKDKFKNDKIGIIGAHIRVYTDELLWNNSYEKPLSFVFLQKDATAFLPEVTTFSAVANYSLVKAFNTKSNQAYYDFTITKTLKEIVEKEATNKDFVVHVGTFLSNENSQLYGYQYDTRAYTPNRLVFVGSDAANSKKIQLKVNYGTK